MRHLSPYKQQPAGWRQSHPLVHPGCETPSASAPPHWNGPLCRSVKGCGGSQRWGRSWRRVCIWDREHRDTSGIYELIDLTHSTLLKNKNHLISCELQMACFVSGLFFHLLQSSRDDVMYTIKYLQPVLHIQQQSCNLDRKWGAMAAAELISPQGKYCVLHFVFPRRHRSVAIWKNSAFTCLYQTRKISQLQSYTWFMDM